jgi:multicomponent Na+:H+ antiporter subunit E
MVNSPIRDKGFLVMKSTVFGVTLLTVIWIVLRENLSVQTALTGLLASAACIYFCHRFLPLPKTSDIRLIRLLVYFLFLIGQVYIAGISVIRILLTGSGVRVVDVKTGITNPLLRTILVNSITLIPGSVSLELEDCTITVLWLVKREQDHTDKATELLLHKLERMLRKAEG